MRCVGIVQLPEAAGVDELRLAVQRAEMLPVDFLWHENEEKLRTLDGYVIADSFSHETEEFIAGMDILAEESAKGKPVLGIGRGAQCLVAAGLIPGVEGNKVAMRLAENQPLMMQNPLLPATVLDERLSQHLTWIYLRLAADYQRNAFTQHLSPRDILPMQVTEAAGRFVMGPALLAEVLAQGLGVFQYCDEQGLLDPHFPVNPNGSMENIAAIANKAGNILAMIPHPECMPQGDAIFLSMRDYILAERYERVPPLAYYPRR